MKARNSIKVLINSLPIVAIVGLGLFLYQQHQTSQAFARPDYDDPNAEYKKPVPSDQLPQTQTFQVKRVSDGDTIVLEVVLFWKG